MFVPTAIFCLAAHMNCVYIHRQQIISLYINIRGLGPFVIDDMMAYAMNYYTCKLILYIEFLLLYESIYILNLDYYMLLIFKRINNDRVNDTSAV